LPKNPGNPDPQDRSKIGSLSSHPLFRNILKVASGNLLGNVLNLLALVILGIALGDDKLGMFTSLHMTMVLIAQLSDFGLSTTIIKFYSDKTRSGHPLCAEALLRYALGLRTLTSAACVLPCLVYAEPICQHWLKNIGSVGTFRLACIGGFGSSLWMFCQVSMQSRKQFSSYAIFTALNHGLKLVLFLVLISAHMLDVSSAIWVYISIPFIGSLMASTIWPRTFWTAQAESGDVRGELSSIFRMSKWIFLSTIIASLMMRTDVFMLRLLLDDDGEVGQFGFAYNIAQGFPMLAAAISTILLPELASTRNRRAMLAAARNLYRGALVLAAIVILVMIAGHILIPLIRNGEFNRSRWVLDLLAAGMSISVIVNPLSFFCLAFNRAWWLTAMNLIQLILNAVIDYFLIPSMGSVAAGISTLSVRLFALVFVVIAFRRLLRKADENDEPAATG
jgi:O-antigen/teichoic acid export membrane protein